jgi:hypothetical protein
MPPFVLPWWLILFPVVTYGLLAYAGRAHLGARLSAGPIGRTTSRSAAFTLSWAAGHLVFTGLNGVNSLTGGILEQAAMFTLLGALAFLAAANAEIFNRWGWTDLLARMMAEIGSLAYAAAIVALLMHRDDSRLFEGFLLSSVFATWLLYHIARLLTAGARSGRMAAASGTAL